MCYNSYIILVFIILFWCLEWCKAMYFVMNTKNSEWNEGVWCRSFLYTCFSPTTRPKYSAIKKGKEKFFFQELYFMIEKFRGAGSLKLWPVYHERPQPFKKHPKHGFYPWLKWHPEHITWVVFDTLNRDFCLCQISYPKHLENYFIPLQASFFSNPKQGKLIGKNLVTSSGYQGTEEA